MALTELEKQRRLAATSVRVRGELRLVELAGNALSEGGLGVDAHAGPGLELHVDDESVVVRTHAGWLEVRSAGCRACAGAPSGPLPAEDGPIAASLAAQELVLRVLGSSEPTRCWRVDRGSISKIPFGDRCEEHR